MMGLREKGDFEFQNQVEWCRWGCSQVEVCGLEGVRGVQILFFVSFIVQDINVIFYFRRIFGWGVGVSKVFKFVFFQILNLVYFSICLFEFFSDYCWQEVVGRRVVLVVCYCEVIVVVKLFLKIGSNRCLLLKVGE